MPKGQSSIAEVVFEQAFASPAVRAAVEDAARSRLAKARYLALKAGRPNFAEAMRVVVGVRPGAKARGGLKRPYARIISTITPEQHAADNRTAKLSRTQILRRAGS